MARIRPRLVLLERRDVPTTVLEAEPNNLVFFPNDVPIATGNVLTTANDDWLTVQAAIDTLTDRDYFRITLTANSGVFFNVNSRDIGLSTTLDTVLDVYDSAGVTLLGSNDEGYDVDSFAAPANGVPAATSPDSSFYLDLGPGTYIVRVTSFQSQSFGGYQLRMLADTGYSATVPTFDSRIAAPVTLYLDFDGHAATDDWGTYSATAFNLAGSPSTVSPGERLAIHNVWRVVSDDFSPFDVNVTTTTPPSFADGVAYRMVVTSDSGMIIGQSASLRGIALPGSFAGTGVNTGFVFQPGFSNYLGGVSGTLMATTLEQGNESSKQFGTSCGLLHYGGINGQPYGIMQNPDTGLNRSTWSTGLTHSGETPVVMQNDVATITSMVNGIVNLPDDHGDSIATSTPMSGSSITGVLNPTADRDMFRFVASQGNAIIKVSSDIYTGNADLELRIFDQSGQLFATANPADSFDAGITVYLPVATAYYAEVRGNNVSAYRLDLSFAPVTGPGQVLSTTVNGGAIQRSMVFDIGLRFTRPVTFPNGLIQAIVVSNVNGSVPVDVDLTGSTASQTIALVRFPNGSGGFGSIADGNFHLTIYSINCLDDANQQLDGDSDGLAGGNFVYSFFRLFGDQDGDRSVSVSDFLAFRPVLGGSSVIFDYNGDGSISVIDFIQFRLRFGATL